MADAVAILETLVGEVDGGRRVALCAIVAARGSTPQPAGTFVCVDEAARMTGTLGGGCVEADVRRQAHQLLSSNRNELITFALDHDFGYDDGMICGGQIDVAVSVLSPSSDVGPYRIAIDRLRTGQDAELPLRTIATGKVRDSTRHKNDDEIRDENHGKAPNKVRDEDRGKNHEKVGGKVPGQIGNEIRDEVWEYRIHIEAEPKLVIVGAGHISRILARMMLPLGFSIHVIDDRADYANADRFPQPISTTVGDITSTLKAWPIDANTYVVLVTRGHKHDEAALAAVLDSPARYIGMIGSRRKVKVIRDDLLRAGADESRLSRVHAPIGLDINAVTTDEIALSVAAQLISIRRADRHRAVEGPILVEGGAL